MGRRAAGVAFFLFGVSIAITPFLLNAAGGVAFRVAHGHSWKGAWHTETEKKLPLPLYVAGGVCCWIGVHYLKLAEKRDEGGNKDKK